MQKFKNIFTVTFTIWIAINNIIHPHIIDKFPSQLHILINFYLSFFMPIALTAIIYLLWSFFKKKRSFIKMIGIILLLVIVFFNLYYGIVKLVLYTNVSITSTSEKSITKIIFEKKRNYLPLLINDKKNVFNLRIDNYQNNLNYTIPLIYKYKPMNKEKILVAWGEYEIHYFFKIIDTIKTSTLPWTFKHSFSDTLLLP